MCRSTNDVIRYLRSFDDVESFDTGNHVIFNAVTKHIINQDCATTQTERGYVYLHICILYAPTRVI